MKYSYLLSIETFRYYVYVEFLFCIFACFFDVSRYFSKSKLI